jgi:glycosyltransferase involved in cell wall biosynthesis
LVSYGAKNSGVFKKIKDQFNTWQDLGVTANLFVLTDNKSVKLWKSIDPNAVVLVDNGIITKIVNRIKIVKLADLSGPNVIYLRDSFPLYIPKTVSPVCLEVQSLYGKELLLRSKFRYLIFKIASKLIYRNVKAAVYVTAELMRFNEANCKPNIEKIVIGNGIDLERIDPLPEVKKSKLAMFFVGHPNQKWHGVEDLVDFARANSDLDLHIVGLDNHQNLPNVYSYGLLNIDEYRAIAEKCAVGIGSLKLEVNGMTEASPLKTREYLAMGLPIITRYLDPDFLQSPNFILRLPQDGEPLEAFSTKIRNFIEFWAGRRVLRDEISHLDVREKEKIRLEFLSDLTMKGNL